jgi:hypothetical protein
MRKILTTGLFLALGSVAVASAEDEMTSLSYISYLERYATVQPASGDESLEAVINMPLVGGDRVDTAREARMEVVLADGNTLWLDEYTTLSLDAVAFSRDSEAERSVIYLAEGAIIVEVTEYGLASRPTRVDSRGAVVYLNQVGLYRLQALPSGGIRVEVMSGVAEASTAAGGVLIRSETAAEVGGGEVQRSETQLTWNDDFAAWVEMRRQIAAGESAQHVDLRYSRQAAQLDNYGSWLYVDSINAWAWQPTVGGSWQPYNAGRWYWTPTGYAWISYEPWGWLPYHYGSWYHDVGYGWVWSWGRHWAPAWVSWMWWPGYVGWCPYGYYNSWYWGNYGGYYPGYYPPHNRPPYPGGGGSAAQPPRRDVMPPGTRVAGSRMGLEGSEAGETSAAAVDLNGRVRLAEVDRRGWTAVAQEDFASPNQARLSSRGDRVMPTDPDQTGVVMTGPLATRSPGIANPSSEIERVFRGVESRTSADISPLMARDGSLSPEAAQRLAPRTTIADISRRSTASAAANRQVVSPRLSTGTNSPFATSGGTRPSQPNLYRPTLYSSSPGSSTGSLGSGSASGSRGLVAPRGSSGATGSLRPVIVPGTGSSVYSRPPASSRLSPSGSRSPTSVGSSFGRYSAPRSSSVGGSRSTTGSRSRSSVGSTRAPSSRSIPSVGSSRSSGGSSRSSAGSTRSSGGGSSKSSGGARKR